MIKSFIYRFEYLGYFLSKSNGLCKDIDWSPVMDLASCKEAVYDIQQIRPNAYRSGANGMSEVGQPGGCYLFTGGSGNAIKFNKNLLGPRSNTGRQICIPNKGNHKCDHMSPSLLQKICEKITILMTS